MRNGFTLIELFVVVTIIGILLAIAIPQYKEYKERSNGKGKLAPTKAEVINQSKHHERFKVKSPSGKCYEVFYTTEDIRMNSVTETDCR